MGDCDREIWGSKCQPGENEMGQQESQQSGNGTISAGRQREVGNQEHSLQKTLFRVGKHVENGIKSPNVVAWLPTRWPVKTGQEHQTITIT